MSFTVDAVTLPDGFADVFDSRRVPAGDVTLHAVTGGSGPPLLLLPGWPQFWYGWRLMMPGLAERFTVVAADLRGTGASDKPAAGYDLPTLADDVAALMDGLGHDRYAVAGFDLGMLVGFSLAVRHPDRITGLVLSEALLPGADIGPMIAAPELNELMWHIPFNRAGSVNERMVAGREEVYFGHQFTSKAGRPDAIPQYAIDTYVAALRDPAALHASFEFFRRGVGLPFRDVTLSAPVLAVGAERSVGPLVAELVRRHTTDVEELVVPGVGHFVPEEAPEAFTAAMIAFLGGRCIPGDRAAHRDPDEVIDA